MDTFERQIFDMNCNDCKHLVRSFVGRQQHEDLHYQMQKSVFNAHRIKLLKKAEKHIKKGFPEKAKEIFKEVKKMNFVYSSDSTSLSFGKCQIKDKNKIISFIPNIVMEENYHCFKHRKE